MGYSKIRSILSIFEPSFTRLNSHLPFLTYLANQILQFLRKAQVFVIEGTNKDDSIIIVTLFIGNEQSAYQFANLTYSKITSITCIGEILPFRFDPSFSTKTDIIAINGSMKNKCVKHDYLLLPYVTFSLDTTRPIKETIKGMSRRRRRDLKKLRAYDFKFKISRENNEELNFFYRNMYLPYAKTRFGKAAQTSTYTMLKDCYKRNGGIAFALEKDKAKAAILFQIRGKTLYALKFGANTQEKGITSQLAGQALLLFLIDWAKKKNIKRLDYGTTMPFFNDGVFQYKKEWGMFIEKHSNQIFCALKPNPSSKHSISFLSQNPCIIYDNGKINGVVLQNHRLKKTELQHICAKHRLPKLDALTVICYSSPTDTAGQINPKDKEEKAPRIAKSLSSIFAALQRQGLSYDSYEFVFNHKV